MLEVLEVNCSSPVLGAVLSAFKNIIGIIQIIGPILLIIALVLHLTKLVQNPEDKKLVKKIWNSVLAACLLFFIPMFLNVVMSLLGENFTVSSCWNSITNNGNSSSYINPYENNQSKNFYNDEDYENGSKQNTTGNTGSVGQSDFSKKMSNMSTPSKSQIESAGTSIGLTSDYVKIVVGTTQREGYINDAYLSYGWASAMINNPVSLSTMQGWDPYHNGDNNYYSWKNILNGYNNASSDTLKAVYIALTNRNTKIVECNGMYSTTPSQYNKIYTSTAYPNISIYEKK